MATPAALSVLDIWDGLNPNGVEEGLFVIVRGYIDESYDTNLFTLSCILADGKAWFWIEQEWIKCIEARNRTLIAAGRRPLSRYHATNCNGGHDEFEDWTKAERDEFSKSLVGIIRDAKWFRTVSLSLSLKELSQEIPEARDSPITNAYGVLLKMILYSIGRTMCDKIPRMRISLIHDHCDYDAFLLQCFMAYKDDPTFEYRSNFTSITALTWQDCVALQPADFIAYEHFKEAKRHFRSNGERKPGRLRKPRAGILSIRNATGSSGTAQTFTRAGLKRLRKIETGGDPPEE